jgi:CRISPR-associated endonuclease Csn1
MKTKSEADFLAYIERVNELYKNKQIGKAKRDKLLMAGDKIREDFIDRQLRESQYIAKKAREILMTICKNVWATSGKVTAELRHIWGWDDVLMKLHLPKYRDLGYTTFEEYEHNGQKHKREIIKGWTKRDDHRHHAIDALTIACTKQGYIQRLNTLNASKTKEKMYSEVKEARFHNGNNAPGNHSTLAYEQQRKKLYEEYLLLQRPFTTSQVEEAASKILVSFKPGKKVATFGKRKIRKNGKKVVAQSDGIIVPRGALSEESVYGKIKFMETNKPLKYLFENPHLIVKPYIKTLVEERLSSFENDVKKAIASVKKDPLMIKGSVPLEFASCYRDEYVIKYTLDTNFKRVEKIIDKKLKAIVQKRLDDFNGNYPENRPKLLIYSIYIYGML